MGFLSDMKNKMTGGWADVQIRTNPQLQRGQDAPVAVDVQVNDDDIMIDAVVVEVSVREKVSVRGARTAGGERVNVSEEEVLHSQEFTIATDQTLGAGQSGTFDGHVSLPAGLPPSARGRIAEFRWQVRARLDMKGNDPDSGWQVVEVT